MDNSDISILILDKSFTATYAVSEFFSFIWVERYYACGVFELQCMLTLDNFNNIKVGNYVWINGSDTLMVIEKVQIGWNPERTSQLLVYTGRTIESILDRRIIWGKWSISDTQPIQASFFNLISANAVNPSDKDRKLDMFSLGLNLVNPELDKHKVSASGFADNLLEVIWAACESEGVGFRARYVDGASTCVLQFYIGDDRSYDQLKLPPVIFSASYENLGGVRYGLDTTEYKTLVYAYGPEETYDITDSEGNVTTAKDQTILVVGSRKLTGLNRREMSVKAQSSYPNDIQQKAMEELAKVDTLDVIDAELDNNKQFQYGKDFFMGDIVQVITEFGLDARARVTEFARYWSAEGYTEVPTFEILDDNEFTTEVLGRSRSASMEVNDSGT